MPAPNHMVAFASKSEISAFDFSDWPNGTPVACLENKSWYFLDKSSSAVADSENVLTSVSGKFVKDRATSFATAKPSTAPLFVGQELTVLLDTGTITQRLIRYVAINTTSSASGWVATGGSAVHADDSPSFYGIVPDFIGQEWNDDFNRNYYKAVDYGNGLEWANIGATAGT